MKLSKRRDNRAELFLASSMRLHISSIVSVDLIPELSISALSNVSL